MPKEFQYFYEKYWMKLPKKSRRDYLNKGEISTFSAYLGVIAGDFGHLDEDLHKAELDVQESVKDTTVGCIESSLEWWCYFALLDRSGIHEAAIRLPGLPQDDNERTDCLTVSDYFEKSADEYGMKFAKARAKYDYQLIKNTYRKCAGEV